MKRKTIRLDDETNEMLLKIDEKFNMKPNHNAVIIEAIQRFYYAEKLQDSLNEKNRLLRSNA